MALYELKRLQERKSLTVSRSPIISLVAMDPLNPLIRFKSLLFNFHDLKFPFPLFSDYCH